MRLCIHPIVKFVLPYRIRELNFRCFGPRPDKRASDAIGSSRSFRFPLQSNQPPGAFLVR
jgi:hypothetical protein